MNVLTQRTERARNIVRPEAEAMRPCPNCGAGAPGNYCPSCGQETRIELPSAFAFLRDAAGRYIRFDGRMWRTLAALLLRPGFLTREYLVGRRRRYVAPARLFVALSIVLFAVMRLTAGTPTFRQFESPDAADGGAAKTRAEVRLGADDVEPVLDIDLGKAKVFAPVRERLDAFNKLPRDLKGEQLKSGLFRYAPYAAIALLPLFALLVALAYAGSRGRHPDRPRHYAAHLVFGAHLHAFAFVVATFVVVTPWAPLHTVLVVGAFVYALVALKAVYGGRWPGVVLRAGVIGLVYLLLFAVATAMVGVAAVLLR
jgi:rRNA maturation protein Nop10